MLSEKTRPDPPLTDTTPKKCNLSKVVRQNDVIRRVGPQRVPQGGHLRHPGDTGVEGGSREVTEAEGGSTQLPLESKYLPNPARFSE